MEKVTTVPLKKYATKARKSGRAPQTGMTGEGLAGKAAKGMMKRKKMLAEI